MKKICSTSQRKNIKKNLINNNNMKDVFLLINPDKINNICKKSKFKPIYYYYKHKQKQIINDKNIIKIEISKIKQIKNDCFYKDVYKSSKDEYFDIYYKLKDKYRNCEEIYIEQEKTYKKREVKIKKKESKKNMSQIH